MTRRACSIGRTLAVAMTLSVSLSIAGCGNDGSVGASDPSAVRLRDADEALTRAEFMPAVHAAAVEAETAHVAVVMTAAGEVKAAGDVAFDSDGPRMNLKMQSGDKTLGMRLVEGECFLQIPGVTAPDEFLAVDPNEKNTNLLQTCAILTDQMVPLIDVEAMQSAVQKVERVGQEQMDGLTVEQYQVSVDTSTLLHARGSTRDATGMPETIEYHYWIDKNNLTHRRSYKIAEIDFDARMTKWGEPVEIQTPPDSHVLTMPDA